jgi:hypothetical protein
MGFPESELIRSEIVLRDMQFLSEVKLAKKSLVRWLALSLGLISPNETRTLILDILEALFGFHFAEHAPTMHEIISEVARINPQSNHKAVRYHISQLKKQGILLRTKGRYSFSLSPLQENRDVGAALEYLYVTQARSSFEKIRKAISALEHTY